MTADTSKDLAQHRPPGDGHLAISGTGRAGTTLLVRILTRLGLDTGFTLRQCQEAGQEIGRAGLEHPISPETAAALPDIIKTPYIADFITRSQVEGWLPLAHVIVPVRKLNQAAGSRRSVSRRAVQVGMNPLQAPGGLWDTADPAEQEKVLAVKFHHLIEAVVEYDIPLTLLSFPRFATDSDYFVAKLLPVLAPRYGLSGTELLAGHSAEVRREFIGDHG